jgi:CubicO group peptidase (beta-lactamase class C family)
MRNIRFKTIGIFIMMIITINLFFAKNVFAQEGITKEQIDKIDAFVKEEMKAIRIPGVAVGIVKNDSIVYLKGYGVSDGKNALVTENTRFDIGSITKSITALAIRKLINEGKINENDYVVKYLPEFQTKDKDNSDKIKISQLLQHTSGFSTYQGNAFLTFNLSLEEQILKLKETALAYKPGEVQEYSNINFMTLGLIVTKVSGKSYDEYVRENVFKPLDMNNTFNPETETLDSGMSKGSSISFGYALSSKHKQPKESLATGFITSSAKDMCNYAIAIINNGYYKGQSLVEGNKLPKLNSNSEIYKRSKAYDQYWNIIDCYENTSFGHAGASADFTSSMLVHPVRGEGVVVLANVRNDLVGDANQIANGISTILYKGTPIVAPDSNFNKYYLKIKMATVFIFILLAIHFFRLKSFKSRASKSNKRFIFNIVFSALVNYLLPLIIFLAIPIYFKTSLGKFVLFSPLEILQIPIIAMILLIVGVLKSIWIYQLVKEKHKEKVNNLLTR